MNNTHPHLSPHLSPNDLILFMDREMEQAAASQAEQHLLVCIECGQRLQDLQRGSTDYKRYHERLLKPALQVPESSWPRLGDRLKRKPRIGREMWWAAAAFAATSVLVWLYLGYYSGRNEPGAQEVLEKAEAVPEIPRGELVFTTSQTRFTRPAVLETQTSEAQFRPVQALFVQSGYSWSDPLSARSFNTWRRHLSEKRDFVTAIHEGGRQFYRIRTRTDSGILHSASLMLEAASYHPTKASFEFQGEDLIEISEQTSLPPNKPLDAQVPWPPPHPKAMETAAGPEDELRVFAALDAIGADAEEPIDVKLDAGHHTVLVTGMGMASDRRKQIETALAALPNTVVRFGSGQSVRAEPDASASPDPAAQNGSPPFRNKLQEMAGGARQLQMLTDESLETSNALFAQSHSLLVLAQEFPPAVEGSLVPASSNTLLALRQRHLGAMSYALRRLRDQLRPLLLQDVLMTEGAEASAWQTQSERLYEATRNLDRVVSRLLAGSYDAQTGELMLKQLPDHLARVETLVRADGR